jgi:PAS domain S-box-containing protein
LPIIIVTGTLDEETAAETIKQGAWDYVVKERLFRLPTAIRQALKIKREIEKKKDVEQALLKAETEYETLKSNVPLALYRLSKEKLPIYVNNAFVEMLGFDSTVDVFDAQFTEHFVRPRDFESLMEVLLKKAIVKNYELELIKKDGTKIWGAFNVSAIFDSSGNFVFQDGIITDITEIKQAREELIRAKQKAEQSDKLKSAFLANMSHEIRTPMNAIIGFADLLRSNEPDTGSMDEYIKHINENSATLLRIINDVIDIAKIESGSLEVHKSKLRVNQLLTEVLKEFESELVAKNKHGIQAKLNLPEDCNSFGLHTDIIRVNQIIRNLLDNAVKFTEQGSIEFGYSLEDDLVTFFVRDSGIGVSDEMHELIFERFRQVDDSHTRAFGGTGLGLTIAKSLVGKLGGKIWVESKLYQGSTFFFTIPIESEEQEKVSVPVYEKTPETVNWANKKLLIAEDVESNFYYLKTILKKTNIQIFRANDGKEAIEIAKENPDIDLVLMDVQMPNVNGYDATLEIRKFRKDVSIIGQTAFALSSDLAKLVEVGCNDYLVKPILRKTLFDMLHKYIVD